MQDTMSLFSNLSETSAAGEPRTGSRITILSPCDTMDLLKLINVRVTVTMLDPWYNRGVGGVTAGYDNWLARLVKLAAKISDHVFLWGFPDIVYRQLDRLPKDLRLVEWLTWYYKNCPSVIRGWRSAQLTCLHLAKPDAKIYVEHFLNGAQEEKRQQGKLRYIPGPASVIEVPLNIGFVGRNEQTGHPAQKPEKVFEPLFLMTTKPGDLILDPMCGSGTTGAVCRRLGRDAILCDASDEYIRLTEKRLELKRAHPLKYLRKKS